VNAYEPAAVGAPLMMPVDAFSVRPVGSEPDVIAKEMGAVPPDVCTVWLYDPFRTPADKLAVAIAIASAETIVPL
jgi:hypothetical protein